jgi:hypothetical protein
MIKQRLKKRRLREWRTHCKHRDVYATHIKGGGHESAMAKS